MNRPDTILIPESVALDLHPAGLGSRVIAAVIDTLIQGFIMFGVQLGYIVLVSFASKVIQVPEWVEMLIVAVFITIHFVVFWGYHVFFEVFRNGQTPGKRRMGLRVVRENGQALTLVHSGLRNIVRVIDWLPSAYVIGLISTAISSRGKRVGDIVAGTLVVVEGEVSPYDNEAQPELLPEDAERLMAAVPSLDYRWMEDLRHFMQQRPDLPPGVRALRAAQLANYLHERVSLAGDYPAEDLLVWVVQMARR